MKKALFAGALLVAAIVGVSAQPTGSEIVSSGKIATISGRLIEQDDELYLITKDGKVALHLGPEWSRDEIRCPERARGEATVEGYLDKLDMSPARITFDGKSYTFRDKDGQPMWRGDSRNGQGRGGRGRAEAPNSTRS